VGGRPGDSRNDCIQNKACRISFSDSANAPKQDKCRGVFQITQTEKVDGEDVTETLIKATVWCIEDIMDPKKNSSSSEEKGDKLPLVFNSEKDVDLVIAFGTAGFNDRITSFNGSVTIGSEFFSFNAKPGNTQSDFKNPLLGQYLPANIKEPTNEAIFKIFNDRFRDMVESKFVSTPNAPAPKARVLAASNYVAVSNINITSYNDYAWADEEGIAKYHAIKEKSPIGSIETTHGVIRMCTTFPTIFVSAIADRLGYFKSDVTPTQNFAASFNGGILLAHLIPALIPIN